MTYIQIHGQPVPQRLPDDYARCYGVACEKHGRCLRYLAIDGDTAWRPSYIDTCEREGPGRPMFMEVRNA